MQQDKCYISLLADVLIFGQLSIYLVPTPPHYKYEVITYEVSDLLGFNL